MSRQLQLVVEASWAVVQISEFLQHAAINPQLSRRLALRGCLWPLQLGSVNAGPLQLGLVNAGLSLVSNC